MKTPGVPTRDALRAWQVAALYTAVTALLACPLVRHPAGHVLTVSPDTDLFLWTLSWDAHALVRQPLAVFDANIFAPLHRTLAYSEHLIGSGMPAAPVLGLTHNPVLAMNLVALLILPAIIAVQDNAGVRYGVSGVSLVVLIGAVAWSKRDTEPMDSELPPVDEFVKADA